MNGASARGTAYTRRDGDPWNHDFDDALTTRARELGSTLVANAIDRLEHGTVSRVVPAAGKTAAREALGAGSRA